MTQDLVPLQGHLKPVLIHCWHDPLELVGNNGLQQGSPTPGPRTGTGLQPVRDRATQQEVSGGRVSEASSAAPHYSPSLALPLEPSPFHHLWKNCLPRNQSLVPKRFGTAGLQYMWWKCQNCLGRELRKNKRLR